MPKEKLFDIIVNFISDLTVGIIILLLNKLNQ